jgi:hypothetical protein
MIYPCQRCKEIFKSQEEVSAHLKGAKGCELREIEIRDGITCDTVERLKSRKKTRPSETEEDRWRKLYSIIFPGCTSPSPCKYFCKFKRSSKFSAHGNLPLLTEFTLIQTLSSQPTRLSWMSMTNTAAESCPTYFELKF